MTPNIRRMRPNHGTTGLPSSVIFFDTETITLGTEQRLHFGWGEHWSDAGHRTGMPKLQQRSGCQFTTPGAFWDWVESCTAPRRTLYVVAHNFGGFDAMVVHSLEELTNRGWKAEKVIMGTPPFVIRARRDSLTVILIDSLNYFRTSLADLGKAVGIAKGEDPGPQASIEERLQYCQNDVTILREAMCAYWRFVWEEDLGTYAVTLAGQSMNSWRHRFMPPGVLINHTPAVTKLEREGYCGGRVSEFHRGVHQDIALFDENSMFPHKMREHRFPIRLMHATTVDTRLKLDLSRQQARYGHIAEVWLNVPKGCDWYPLKHNGRLIFPTGEFRTVLCGPELYRALDHGHVTRVGRLHIYEMGDMFSAYVDHFYYKRLTYRADGNDVFAYMCKIFMNSLYGKFGQQTPEWEESKILDGPGLPLSGHLWDGENATVLRTVMGKTEVRTRVKHEAYNSMCAVAAFVTAYAREDLLQVMDEVGRENVLYCDTDSVYVTQAGRRRLEASGRVDASKLGAWKMECESATLELRGLKDYTYGDKVKIKGVRAHSKSTEQKSADVYVQDMFVSIVGAIRRGHTSQMHVLRVEKHLARECLKGMLQPSGRVDPFTFVREQLQFDFSTREVVMVEPFYQDEFVTIYNGDCAMITQLTADVLVTDPPYGMSFKSGWSGRSISGDSNLGLRNGLLEAWGDKPALVFGTWKVPRPHDIRTLLIWDKGKSAGMGNLKLPWGNSHEEIYVLGDGWVGSRGSSVLHHERTQNVLHPNEKPVSLLTDLIRKCPSGVIIDPFMGSGATLVAAKQLGRQAIGIELDANYCRIAAERVQSTASPVPSGGVNQPGVEYDAAIQP